MQNYSRPNKYDKKQRGPWTSTRKIMLAIGFLVTVIAVVLPTMAFNTASPIRLMATDTTMMPTIQMGEYYFVEHFTYTVRSPQRGDIVVFTRPENPSNNILGRVIGVAGDNISVAGSTSMVNGKIIEESYVYRGKNVDFYTNGFNCSVPPKFVLVMGDNRSEPSSNFGLVPISFINGRMLSFP